MRLVRVNVGAGRPAACVTPGEASRVKAAASVAASFERRDVVRSMVDAVGALGVARSVGPHYQASSSTRRRCGPAARRLATWHLATWLWRGMGWCRFRGRFRSDLCERLCAATLCARVRRPLVAVSASWRTVACVLTPRSVNIAVVDQHAVVRHALAALVSSEADIAVLSTARCVEDIDFTLEPRLDVVVFAGLSTPEECRAALDHVDAQMPKVHSVVVVDDRRSRVVSAAVSAGARGVLCRDTPPEAFVHAVRAAATGAAVLDAALLVSLSASSRMTDAPLLSSRESDVLARIAAGSRNSEIAAALYLSTETVKTHVAHVLRKLEVSNRREAVREARRLGLIR